MLVRQTETQRILQEMLLDIVVEQLEERCYAKNEQGQVVARAQRKSF